MSTDVIGAELALILLGDALHQLTQAGVKVTMSPAEGSYSTIHLYGAKMVDDLVCGVLDAGDASTELEEVIIERGRANNKTGETRR